MHTNKILAICPSIHPIKADRMWKSFAKTTHGRVATYSDTSTDKTITQIFNEAFKKSSDKDFYMMLNDDIIFETDNWDLKLANKGRISYGNDGIQGKNLCTFPMIDGDIVRALGWLQLPSLNRYCGDVVWRTIGNSLGILDYHDDVKITHHWEGCSDPDMNTIDMGKFAEWLAVSQRDINKIKEIL